MKLAIVLALVTTARLAEAKCQTPEPLPAVGTSYITPEGAVFVTNSRAGYSLGGFDGEPTFTVDGATRPYEKRVLAPGLTVYRLPPRAKSGEATVGETSVRARAARAPTLAAPRVKALTNHRMRRQWGVDATLKGAVPEGAIAIVMTSADGTPMSWQPIRAPLSVFHQSGCEIQPDGLVVPTIGQKVRLLWVDSYGRYSPPSALVTITAGTSADE